MSSTEKVPPCPQDGQAVPIVCPPWCTLTGTDHCASDLGEYAHVGEEVVIRGTDGELRLHLREYVDRDGTEDPFLDVQGTAHLTLRDVVRLAEAMLSEARQVLEAADHG